MVFPQKSHRSNRSFHEPLRGFQGEGLGEIVGSIGFTTEKNVQNPLGSIQLQAFLGWVVVMRNPPSFPFFCFCMGPWEIWK